MANLALIPLLLIISHLHFTVIVAESVSAIAKSSSPRDFIEASCRSTRYRTLCVRSLSRYASSIRHSQRKLVLTALSVSLDTAKLARKFVSTLARDRKIGPRELGAAKDCLENVGDGIDRLGQSVKEIGRAEGRKFDWCISNVQTWVSAALTNDNTCLDGFGGGAMDGDVKAAIGRNVKSLARVTSNALALVNNYASKHRAGEDTDQKH